MPRVPHRRLLYNQWFTNPHTVVVQPTTWCNLDCSYCYLPLRKLKHRMSAEVAAVLARSVAGIATDDGPPIGVVWHGGEPLTVGVQHFAALLSPFEELREAGRVHHYVQTNATLITSAWCDLLDSYGVRVGVSIDGPQAKNGERVDLRGKPAFDRIMRGIGRLRERGIPFSVISVVTQNSMVAPEELLEFLTSLGCDSVGFNIEETEGANVGRQAPLAEQAEEFWRRTLTWCQRDGYRLKVREIERLAEYLRLIRDGEHERWGQRHLDPIPTVSFNGDVVLLSPELADTTDPAYDDFLVGNILRTPLAEIIDNAHRIGYVSEFMTGLNNCRARCPFFDFCRGAQAANRYFENGDLSTTETNHCRVSRQALVTALSTLATHEEGNSA
ncbi:cyclophane-forming radical SAM peptide maturase AmcB [Streptomyces uncialis]|uniref:cyclophane-forming radical SAM peptide maturase AmcB n=1 Tax=Streptomyces uncialis TaxID=1048205 RepID=UPI00225272BA|nr:cyclophane-forming radical SAM peptide maturase AmcB [Streptomyces uncialis]MCX4663902.1 radical SAM protein [Streptomyces uncialis]